MQQQLKLSVIVCSYNRAKYIGNVIQKLCDQTADKQSYETIIIDNNSTDETPSICKAVIEENPTHNIRYIPETNRDLHLHEIEVLQYPIHRLSVLLTTTVYVMSIM